ncbi:MAG TPA: FtsX-like permease family protein [Blastocatellia bacterium]|nr:FtsX-like permease family protein [Blastocatellia bacterium]
MKFADIIALAWRNLRQAKLRTSLTVIGVVVGVAAIVTMVSFGLGLQNNLLRDALARIDLFTSITVMGPGTDAMLAMQDRASNSSSNTGGDDNGASSEEKSDGDPSATPEPSPTPVRMLDDAAIAELQSINGIRYVLPNFSFSNYVRFEGRTRRAFIGGAPKSVEYNPRFKTFLAGHHFTGEDAREAVVTERFISWVRSKKRPNGDRRRRPGGPFQIAPTRSEEERAKEANGILGKEIVFLSLREQNAAPSSVFGIPIIDVSLNENGDLPSEFGEQYEERVYRVVGVLKAEDGFDINNFMETDMFIPLDQAKEFRAANRDPMSRIGELLAGDTGYQNAEVRVADVSRVENIKEEIKKRGFRAWSFTNQVEEIRRVFLIVNSALALIGGISLLVASFGISNTMIMSIRERTREIGVMKAIGGSDGEIMRIFFVEASLIGLAGGAIGVLGGWGIDRLANLLANRWILKQAGQAIRHIEFFSIPWYLSSGAILFAIVVSLIAAIYPAMRAAKVDPIKALRYE